MVGDYGHQVNNEEQQKVREEKDYGHGHESQYWLQLGFQLRILSECTVDRLHLVIPHFRCKNELAHTIGDIPAPVDLTWLDEEDVEPFTPSLGLEKRGKPLFFDWQV